MRWVIGDIHGMFQPLQALIAAVRDYDDHAHFHFTGDYVNRGPQSREVIDLLLTLPAAGFVRGNHDEMFDLILNGQSYCPFPLARPSDAFVAFAGNGVRNTFLSYGVPPGEWEQAMLNSTPEAVRALAARVPEAHRRFIRSLAPLIEYDDAFIAHAALDPNDVHENQPPPARAEKIDASDDLRRELLWGRFSELAFASPKRWRRTGYFGHTPVQTMRRSRGLGNIPLRGPRIVLLDTGAALDPNGRLSAVCLEFPFFIQTDPAGRIRGSRSP